MSWKRMIFGEKTPDKNDPKYKERYQKEVEAGRKTARFLKIDRLSAKLQRFATKWPKTFLSIVISLMVFCFFYNIYAVLQVFSRPDHTVTATEIQRQRLEKRRAKEAALLQHVEAKSQDENEDEVISQSVNESSEGQENETSIEDLLSESQVETYRDAKGEEIMPQNVETLTQNKN